MEDALAHEVFESDDQMRGVLILVVMEDALAQAWRRHSSMVALQVLILVVMEDALAPQNLGYALFKRIVRLDCAS